MSTSQVRCKQSLAFFCPALATHQLGMTSDPHAICQSSNRHLRRILDQAAATFFAQRCCTSPSQMASVTRHLCSSKRFGPNFSFSNGHDCSTSSAGTSCHMVVYVLGSNRAQTCASFWNSDFSPHHNVHRNSVRFVNNTFSQPSSKQEMGGISLGSSGNTRKAPSEPHLDGRLYLLAKSFNGVCSKEKGSKCSFCVFSRSFSAARDPSCFLSDRSCSLFDPSCS